MSNQKRNQNSKKTSKSENVFKLRGSGSNIYKINNNVYSLPNSYFSINGSDQLLISDLKPVASDNKYELNTCPFVSLTSPKISPNINDLKEIYNFVNSQEIEHYLMMNKFLVSFLKDTRNQIKNYFKYNEIFLEFIDDSDISETPNLIITINTSGEVDSILESQNKFDENYWLISPLNITKNIIISFDFK